MNSQITLSLRPEILQKAQKAAQEQGISPSDYLVRFLEKVMEEPLREESITAQIERLSKSTPRISEAEYEQRKHDHLSKKHGETPFETIRRLSKGVQHLTDAEYTQRKRAHLMQKHGDR